MAEIVKFEEGNVYEMRFIGDSNMRPKYICTKRTEKMATFERLKENGESFTRKIKLNNNVEYVEYGDYSMTPTIYADKIVE